jgi:hypothetical protein
MIKTSGFFAFDNMTKFLGCGSSYREIHNKIGMDISRSNPAIMFLSISLPFDEILDHTATFTASEQAFDGVLVVIIHGQRSLAD